MSIVSDFGKKVSDKTKELSEKAKIASETNALNNEIKREEGNIEFQYRTIGFKYFEKYAENPDADFLETVNSIKASIQKIEDYKKEIEKIRSRFNCPNCGEAFKIDATFCSKCGFKLPERQDAAQASGDVQKCGNCGNLLKKDALFCNVCGNKLETPAAKEEAKPAEKICPNCNIRTEGDNLFCNECGSKLEDYIPPMAGAGTATPDTNIPVSAENTQNNAVDSVAAAEVSAAPSTPAIEAKPAEKICPNCNNKIEGDDLFCNECGTKIE